MEPRATGSASAWKMFSKPPHLAAFFRDPPAGCIRSRRTEIEPFAPRMDSAILQAPNYFWGASTPYRIHHRKPQPAPPPMQRQHKHGASSLLPAARTPQATPQTSTTTEIATATYPLPNPHIVSARPTFARGACGAAVDSGSLTSSHLASAHRQRPGPPRRLTHALLPGTGFSGSHRFYITVAAVPSRTQPDVTRIDQPDRNHLTLRSQSQFAPPRAPTRNGPTFPYHHQLFRTRGQSLFTISIYSIWGDYRAGFTTGPVWG